MVFISVPKTRLEGEKSLICLFRNARNDVLLLMHNYLKKNNRINEQIIKKTTFYWLIE